MPSRVRDGCLEWDGNKPRRARVADPQALYWKDYAEFEMVHGGNDAARMLFSRCLLQCPNVELWKAYLTLVRKAGRE